MSLLEKNISKKDKIKAGILGTIFSLLIIYVLFTPFSYQNICKSKANFQLKEKQDMKEILSGSLCSQPIKQLNPLNPEIDEEFTKGWMTGLVFNHFKFGLLIFLAYCLILSLKKIFRPERFNDLNEIALRVGMIYCFIMGSIIFYYFIWGFN